LLEKISGKYLTLDDEDTFENARKSSKHFIENLRQLKTGLDECQLVPTLFPALKERVRTDKRPGQFFLSGSVRFTSHKATRDSMTGRIANLELLPFSISELMQLPLPESCWDLNATQNLNSYIEKVNRQGHSKNGVERNLETYFTRGGLPGICFIRDDRIRATRIREQLATILDRDLRTVYPTTLPFSQLLDFLRFLAVNQGEPITYSVIQRNLGISEATQKKLLFALESVFLLRRLPIEGGRKGHIAFLEDQAESYFLQQKDSQPSPADLEGLLYRNIRVQFMYRLGENVREFHFLTRGGARVPFCFQTQSGILGFLPIEQESPNRSDSATAASFLKSYANAKFVFLCKTNKAIKIDNRSVILPIHFVV
jgi:predicted AAA+ superfamily ATPase